MALTADTTRQFGAGDVLSYPVAASKIIFCGAAVSTDATGYARPLTAGDSFLGFAEFKADNGQGAAGGEDILVKSKGYINLAVAGVDVAGNTRTPVYATDDNTFTLEKGTNNVLIGYTAQHMGGNQAMVEFDAALCRAALQA